MIPSKLRVIKLYKMELLQNQQYLILTLFYTVTQLAFTLNFVSKVILLIFHAEFKLILHDLNKMRKNNLTCINV